MMGAVEGRQQQARERNGSSWIPKRVGAIEGGQRQSGSTRIP